MNGRKTEFGDIAPGILVPDTPIREMLRDASDAAYQLGQEDMRAHAGSKIAEMSKHYISPTAHQVCDELLGALENLPNYLWVNARMTAGLPADVPKVATRQGIIAAINSYRESLSIEEGPELARNVAKRDAAAEIMVMLNEAFGI